MHAAFYMHTYVHTIHLFMCVCLDNNLFNFTTKVDTLCLGKPLVHWTDDDTA